MTRTQTIAAVSSLLLLVVASVTVFYATRSTHEIIVTPVQGVQR